MTVGRHFLKNFSLEFTGNLFSKGAWMVAIICMARTIGVELFGIYVVARSYGAIVSLMTEGGVSIITTREIAQLPGEDRPVFVGNMLIVRSFLTVLGGIILLITAFTLMDAGLKRNAILLVGAASLLEVNADMLRAFFRGVEKLSFSAMVVIGQSGFFALGAMIGFLTGKGLFYFLVCYVLSFGLMNLVGIYICCRYFFIPEIRFVRSITIAIIRESWPIAISGFLMVFYGRLLPVFLERFSTVSQAGLFGVAFNFTQNMSIIPMTMASVVLPVFARNAKDGSGVDRIGEKYRYLLKVLLVIIVPAACIISMRPEFFLQLLYGSEFNAAGGCLIVLIWSAVGVSIAKLTKVYLDASGLQYQWTQLLGGVSLYVIFVGYFFVMRQGALGASLTIGSAELMLALAGVIITRRRGLLKLDKERQCYCYTGMKMFFSFSVLMGLLLLLRSLPYAITCILALVGYSMSCIIFNVFKKEEQVEFRQLIGL